MVLNFVDPNIPRDDTNLNAGWMRQSLSGLRTSYRGTVQPSIPAQLVGDIKSFPLNLLTNFNLTLNVDGAGAQTVDCRGAIPSATTLTEVINNINATFTGLAEAFSGYVLLHSTTSGSSSSIQVSTPASNDATNIILGLLKRKLTLPLTVSGADVELGTIWNDTSVDGNHSLRYNTTEGAKFIGENSIFPVDLSVRRNLRVRVDLGTHTIDCTSTGASSANARTLADIVSSINAAISGTDVAFISSTGTLKIQSPTTGTSSVVNIQATGDNAAGIIFGLVTGTRGQEANKLTRVFDDLGFSFAFIRGADVGGAIGTWGLPVETAQNLPTTGVIDGEIRVSRDFGIPHIFHRASGQWLRAIPLGNKQLQYDTAEERYTVQTADTEWLSEPNATGKRADTADIGDIATIVNAKDSAWPDVTYSDGTRNLNRAAPGADDFTRGNTSAGTLGTSTQGGTWHIFATKAKILANEATYQVSDTVTTEERAVYSQEASAGAYTVTATLRKDNASSTAGSEAFAGLMVNSVDSSNGVIIRIGDRGLLEVYDLIAGDLFLRFGQVIDPPLTTTGTVLRATMSGTDPNIGIYWGGSDQEHLWFDEAFVATATVTVTAGRQGGLYMLPSTTGSKNIYVDDFRLISIAQGFIPALSSMSGARLRDTVTAVRTTGTSNIINDCSPSDPLIIAPGTNIDITQDTSNRTLTVATEAGVQTAASHATLRHDDVVEITSVFVNPIVAYSGFIDWVVNFDGFVHTALVWDANSSYTVTIIPTVIESVPFNGSIFAANSFGRTLTNISVTDGGGFPRVNFRNISGDGVGGGIGVTRITWVQVTLTRVRNVTV